MPAISGNHGRGAADNFRIRRVRSRQKYEARHFFHFFRRKKIRALLAAFLERALAHRFFGDDGLLGRADRSVIKSFSRDDVRDGLAHVGGALDKRGHVARTDAVGRLARTVRGAHQTRAARRQNHADFGPPHQLARAFQRRVLHALDQPLRRARRERGAFEQRGRLANALDRGGMRAQHNRVLSLDGNQRLVNCRRGRIRGRNHRRDNADGRRHFDDALFAVLAQNPDGAHAANRARHVHRGERILHDFIGNVAESGFFHGRARQRLRIFRGRFRAGFHDGVDLFLGKCREFFLCGGGSGRQFAGFLDGDEVAIAQAQNALPSPTNVVAVNLFRVGGSTNLVVNIQFPKDGVQRVCVKVEALLYVAPAFRRASARLKNARLKAGAT